MSAPLLRTRTPIEIDFDIATWLIFLHITLYVYGKREDIERRLIKLGTKLNVYLLRHHSSIASGLPLKGMYLGT